jgi:hypothetical protein
MLVNSIFFTSKYRIILLLPVADSNDILRLHFCTKFFIDSPYLITVFFLKLLAKVLAIHPRFIHSSTLFIYVSLTQLV